MSVLNDIFSSSSSDWLKSRDDFKDFILSRKTIDLGAYRFELDKGHWYKSFKLGYFSRGKIKKGIRLTKKALLKLDQRNKTEEKKEEESSL